MAHAATAYLHLLLAWRFYPKRQDSYFVQLFWYLMLLSLALHGVYGAYYLALMFGFHQAQLYCKALGYALLMFYPAILASLFLGELKQPPLKANRLTPLLAQISRDTRRLFLVCLTIAALCLLPAVWDLGWRGQPALDSYSFGNQYALAFVLLFGLLWLLMYLSGWRVVRNNTPINSTRFDFIAISLVLLLSVLTYFTDVQHAWNFTPIISTIGVSLSFCWYRFRTQFIDVILHQFLRIVLLVALTMVVRLCSQWLEQQRYPDDAALLMVFALMLVALSLFYYLNQLLQSLWQPTPQQLTAIQRDLPVLLQACTTNESASQTTGHFLAQLFNTEVSINRPLSHSVQVVHIKGEPELTIYLDYMKRWLPWFSEALSQVQLAGQYLQSHLKVLDALAKEHQQKMQAQEFARLAAKAELMALQSQIRPHFLFNCLNSIHAFITTAPTQAEQMIESLASLIRGVLRMSAQDLVPLSQELELVGHYLALEKMRYGDRFDCQVSLAAGCAQLPVPSFCLQPLVENAIKHAVDVQFEPVSIRVQIDTTEQSLLISVTDDGPGLARPVSAPASPAIGSGAGGGIGGAGSGLSGGMGIALQNIASRLTHLYGAAAQFSLSNVTAPAGKTGALARLQIPLSPPIDRHLQTSQTGVKP
jgi:signal transduction histidine kinase